MRRHITFFLMATILSCLLLVGCAQKVAYTPADLNMKLSSGAAVQKTNNFVMLYDTSGSMGELYSGKKRLVIADEMTRGLVATIPDIKLTSGLRSFGGSKGEEKTELVYGMTSFSKDAFLQALGKLDIPVGRTPLGRAVSAAGVDMMSLPGKSAIIIVSDFQDIPGIDDIRPSSVIDNVSAVKAQFGDRLCIYAVQIGRGLSGGSDTLARDVVREGKCGEAVNADDIKNSAAMSAFVEKIFLGPPETVREEEKKPQAETPPAVVFENIHFDFDKYFLKPPAKVVLNRLGEFMKTNNDATVLIEGYCDERGTIEYNLALGQRRASSAEKYLVSLGVENNRIRTVSYGEELPVDPGHNEEAWAKNRRDEFKINRKK